MTKKAYAKVNVFLKIAGKRDGYHELVSRFCRVKNLFDTISFQKGSFDRFTLEGEFGCSTKSNTIFKAYEKLSEHSNRVEEFFQNHKVVVVKRIPEFAGLGGGSSDCATFMLMVNEYCQLNFSKDHLAVIGTSIGADVPFFIYEYDSANVTGIGEVVKEFKEEPLDIHTITPKVECNTGAIFSKFRERFYKEVSDDEAEKLLQMSSIEIYNTLTIQSANDLYEPAMSINHKLDVKNFEKNEKLLFSGSGSSFFRIVT
jgi:4-diphosphocytidyl-2-C-methyl-D-erythritol kinase